MDTSKSTFSRITKCDLKLDPYMMHVRQEFLEHGLLCRLYFANLFLQRHVRLVEDIVISDEAAFHMNGGVNTHSIRQYELATK